MTTEHDLIFDELYDDFERTMDGEGNVDLISYREENDIELDMMMQIWEAYIMKVAKRKGVK
tara:strand:- start:2648 stop:2830 length:183 start_codon:yes stop_codon:yes gene_type:complete